MNNGRLALTESEYKNLKRKVHQRDKWKCRVCGLRQNLVAHHIVFRSHGGDDVDSNMITLCSSCHDLVHSKGVRFGEVLTLMSEVEGIPINANEVVRFRFTKLAA